MDRDRRVVVVTGASGGLGVAVCRAFLETGAVVAAVSRSGSSFSEPSPNFVEISADLTSAGDAARVVEIVKGRFGRIDALAHLVGGFDGGSPVSATDDGVWRRMFDLNVNAAFYTLRAVLPAMTEAGFGRIVAVGSRTAAEPTATLSAYGASKAALTALIRTVALESGKMGITANLVLPSIIDTPANRTAMPGADFSRWVKPEAIARLIVWLCSSEAGDINGAAVPIYGRA